MSAWHPGEHGTTYGGNAVACAAAVAVIDTIRAERLPERAAALGKRVLDRLRGWTDRFDEVGDVRGLGPDDRHRVHARPRPAPDIAAAVQRRCVENDLLVLTCGIDDNVVRLLPPLTIAEDDLERGVDILERCVAEEVGR